MCQEIIGMDDMMAIYEITDLFGIDRESISVPLERAGAGSVAGEPGGDIEIVAPEAVTTREWLHTLRSSLHELGFELQEPEDEPW